MNEQQHSESVLRTELVAPHPSSVSQYFVHHYYPPPHIISQLSKQSPFLYTGPLILMEHTSEMFQPKYTKNTEKSIENQKRDSYDVYRPSADENPQFVDMFPPQDNQDEPNYYTMKARKSKKYSETESKEKKPPKAKVNDNSKEQVVDDGESEPTQYETSSSEEISSKEAEDERVQDDHKNDNDDEENESEEISAPASRLDFQMHGHKGPASYKFGYDTGKGDNRQLRHEEKDEQGNVFGFYGYYDDKKKFRVVKYSSMADGGFKIL
ncbi:CLUMA_CG013202, isoform A [Clunio marinus]|uniref:CLUMA_CG013202, isoform A n=1 Tax=Clunio marinus TaxID=568069 RepID=A0A1J1II63_9DIPT|nr:CLUMA_CG013202, isoform A [Clunio marinus]